MDFLKKINIFFLFLLLSLISKAQSNSDSTKTIYNPNEDYVQSFDSLKVKDKLHYNFEMGVSVNSNGNIGTYYKPSFQYQISPKITVFGGFLYQNTSINNYLILNDFNAVPFNGNLSQYFAYAGGKYQLTDKLTIDGSIFYDLTKYQSVGGVSFNNASANQINNIGYAANFEYKLSKNTAITGEIRINSKNNPYLNNPFNSSFGGAFGTPFRTW